MDAETAISNRIKALRLAEPAGRTLLHLIQAVFAGEVALLAFATASLHFKSLPAPSGAAVIALSIGLTGALIGCSILMLKSRTDYNLLLDDITGTDRELVQAGIAAARIRSFGDKANREKSFVGHK
jgi:hypothetical protein